MPAFTTPKAITLWLLVMAMSKTRTTASLDTIGNLRGGRRQLFHPIGGSLESDYLRDWTGRDLQESSTPQAAGKKKAAKTVSKSPAKAEGKTGGQTLSKSPAKAEGSNGGSKGGPKGVQNGGKTGLRTSKPGPAPAEERPVHHEKKQRDDPLWELAAKMYYEQQSMTLAELVRQEMDKKAKEEADKTQKMLGIREMVKEGIEDMLAPATLTSTAKEWLLERAPPVKKMLPERKKIPETGLQESKPSPRTGPSASKTSKPSQQTGPLLKRHRGITLDKEQSTINTSPHSEGQGLAENVLSPGTSTRWISKDSSSMRFQFKYDAPVRVDRARIVWGPKQHQPKYFNIFGSTDGFESSNIVLFRGRPGMKVGEIEDNIRGTAESVMDGNVQDLVTQQMDLKLEAGGEPITDIRIAFPATPTVERYTMYQFETYAVGGESRRRDRRQLSYSSEQIRAAVERETERQAEKDRKMEEINKELDKAINRALKKASATNEFEKAGKKAYSELYGGDAKRRLASRSKNKSTDSGDTAGDDQNSQSEDTTSGKDGEASRDKKSSSVEDKYTPGLSASEDGEKSESGEESVSLDSISSSDESGEESVSISSSDESGEESVSISSESVDEREEGVKEREERKEREEEGIQRQHDALKEAEAKKEEQKKVEAKVNEEVKKSWQQKIMDVLRSIYKFLFGDSNSNSASSDSEDQDNQRIPDELINIKEYPDQMDVNPLGDFLKRTDAWTRVDYVSGYNNAEGENEDQGDGPKETGPDATNGDGNNDGEDKEGPKETGPDGELDDGREDGDGNNDGEDKDESGDVGEDKDESGDVAPEGDNGLPNGEIVIDSEDEGTPNGDGDSADDVDAPNVNGDNAADDEEDNHAGALP